MRNIKGAIEFEFFFPREIIFHSLNFLSNNLLTHEYCRLIILDGMPTSCKSIYSKLLISFYLIFGVLSFQINSLCILFSWVVVELGKTKNSFRTCQYSEDFPSRVKFFIFQNFQNSLYFLHMIFEILCIFNFFCCKNNKLRECSQCFL